MKIEQTKDYRRRNIYKILKDDGSGYKFINGTFIRNLFSTGTRCYKMINGEWEYICFYFAEQHLSATELIGQVEYEIKISSRNYFKDFLK